MGGGNTNTASGYLATVGGGNSNTASGIDATVGGGNTNTASGGNATVSGGYYNKASGAEATVPGGQLNTAAGSYSFAAGNRAKINISHNGAFLWADSNNFDFNSSAANEFAVRATGGVRFVTAINGSGNATKTTVITPSGSLGVGTSSPSGLIHASGNLQNPVLVEGDGSAGVSAVFDNYYGSGGVHAGGGLLGRMARGSKASPANVAVNDRLGFNVFGGYAGGAFRHVAAIEALVDSGTISASSLPSAIRFLTTPNGSVARQERMRIDKDGNVTPPSDNTGSIGTASKRWALVRAATVTQGDLVYENGVRSTEEGDGIAFYNPQGKKIAVLDSQGNLRIKGDFIKDPTL